MTLQTVASIFSGIYSNATPNGSVYYLQARDFDADRKLNENLAPCLELSEGIAKHLLLDGDVLIVAKGSSFLSAVYTGEYQPAVASSVFLVIRIKNQEIMSPQYLSWYLNQTQTQNYLLSISRGTSIPSINKKMLLELEIQAPVMSRQKLILEYNSLLQTERQLHQEIGKLKELQLNQIISNTIKN